MSHIDQIDLASLRARLTHALDRQADAGGGSLYLWALGSCFLACSTAEEEIALQDLFYGQARFELVDGDDLISRIILASGGAS